MIKDIIAKNENATPNTKEIEILKTHFPSYFNSEGEFDFERFKVLIDDKVSFDHEGYELKFLGKNYARLLASTDTETVITPDEEHNSLPENKDSGNVYISADNLDALKHLKKSYEGAIKCIYIDPPYNTGTDGFVYKDNFGFTAEELAEKLSIDEESAQRILNFTKKGSASHSAWLMFMYPRLALARDLLTKDGVIFISIDDNEQANLKLICDEIFGEQNFVAVFTRKGSGGRQDSSHYAIFHDYILCYAYNKNLYVAGEKNKKAKYPYYDEEKHQHYNTQLLRKWGEKSRRTDREKMFYPIKTPNGDDYYPMLTDKIEGRWRWGKKTMKENMEKGLVEFRTVKGKLTAYEKIYEPQDGEEKTQLFNTIIDDISNESGSPLVDKMFGERVFSYPKPVDLIERIFEMANLSADDIVLDFFSGSATTAHATMSKNLSSIVNGSVSNVKYIMVQLPEDLNESLKIASSDRKAIFKSAIDVLDAVKLPHTLDQIGMERIKRSADKLREEYPDTTTDLGFKHYTLKEISIDTLDKLDDYNDNSFLENNLIGEFGIPTVLTTWLVRDGYGFSAPVQAVDFEGYTAYYCKDHLYLFNEGISDKAVAAAAEKLGMDKSFTPKNIVLFGYSFNYTQMESLKTNLKLVNDKLKFDVRY